MVPNQLRTYWISSNDQTERNRGVQMDRCEVPSEMLGTLLFCQGESMNVVCMIDKQPRGETGDGKELNAGWAQEGGKKTFQLQRCF